MQNRKEKNRRPVLLHMVIIYSDTAFSLLIQPIAVVGYLFGMFFFLLTLSFLRLEHRLQSSLPNYSRTDPPAAFSLSAIAPVANPWIDL